MHQRIVAVERSTYHKYHLHNSGLTKPVFISPYNCGTELYISTYSQRLVDNNWPVPTKQCPCDFHRQPTYASSFSRDSRPTEPTEERAAARFRQPCSLYVRPRGDRSREPTGGPGSAPPRQPSGVSFCPGAAVRTCQLKTAQVISTSIVDACVFVPTIAVQTGPLKNVRVPSLSSIAACLLVP